MTDQPDLFGNTQCAYDQCNKVFPIDTAVVKDYFNGQTWDSEHYCSKACLHADYLHRLRRNDGVQYYEH